MEKNQLASILIGMLILIIGFGFFSGSPLFLPFVIVGILVAAMPNLLAFFKKVRDDHELESKFPEFVRNLSSAIRSGMPAPRAIIHVSDTDYGALTSHVKKLSNQIEWAIPFRIALQNFAKETKNIVIKRAMDTVIEAERSGGNIEDVLESVTNSVIQIKRIKQARKASIHAQIVQSYVIFGIFIIVMIVIQNFLLPYILDLGSSSMAGLEAIGSTSSNSGAGATNFVEFGGLDFSSLSNLIGSLGTWFLSLRGVFVMIAVIQGFFAGVVLGKLGEGDMKAGLKHSLIMVCIAILIIGVAQSFI
jgi:archaeal flagellar protein FlaJ